MGQWLRADCVRILNGPLSDSLTVSILVIGETEMFQMIYAKISALHNTYRVCLWQ